jgi:hypothetical protein
MYNGLAHGRARVVLIARFGVADTLNHLFLESYEVIIGQLDDAEHRRAC